MVEELARVNFNLRIKVEALEDELERKKKECCKLKIQIYDLEQEITKLKMQTKKP